MSGFRRLILRALGINLLQFEVMNTKKLQQINLSLVRGLMAKDRTIEEKNPASWEFSGFSQNGEDGIIEQLALKIKKPNHYFIEMGASNGIQNNSSWLAIVKRWKGLMIEGSKKLAQECAQLMMTHAPKVNVDQYFISLDNINEIQKTFLTNEPDVFSIDIDGNDFHIMRHLFEKGFKPSIVIVEYNSALGPDSPLSISYDRDFVHKYPLNYGCAIAAWKKLFAFFGYKFVALDSEGVNAFFVNPSAVDTSFMDDGYESMDFIENSHQFKNFGNRGWEFQSSLIKKELFSEVNLTNEVH